MCPCSLNPCFLHLTLRDVTVRPVPIYGRGFERRTAIHLIQQCNELLLEVRADIINVDSNLHVLAPQQWLDNNKVYTMALESQGCSGVLRQIQNSSLHPWPTVIHADHNEGTHARVLDHEQGAQRIRAGGTGEPASIKPLTARCTFPLLTLAIP